MSGVKSLEKAKYMPNNAELSLVIAQPHFIAFLIFNLNQKRK